MTSVWRVALLRRDGNLLRDAIEHLASASSEPSSPRPDAVATTIGNRRFGAVPTRGKVPYFDCNFANYRVQTAYRWVLAIFGSLQRAHAHA